MIFYQFLRYQIMNYLFFKIHPHYHYVKDPIIHIHYHHIHKYFYYQIKRININNQHVFKLFFHY